MTHLAHLTEVAQRFIDADVPFHDAVASWRKALQIAAYGKTKRLRSNGRMAGCKTEAAELLHIHRNTFTKIGKGKSWA